MKYKKYGWVLWTIAFAVAIILMIAIPFARTAIWWIAAISTMLMFALCAYAFHMAFRKGQDMFSKVLGWPIFKVGYIALIVQIIVGGIIMGIASFCPVWAAVIAELIVFAVNGVCLTVKDAAREVVAQSEAQVEDRTAAWKAIRARAINMPEQVREALRYADPMPSSLDNEISAAVDAGDAEAVLKLLEQRKVIAKEEK